MREGETANKQASKQPGGRHRYEDKGESEAEWWSDLFRPISSAAATASVVELKRDSIATSAGKSFFLASFKPCFASNLSALPRAAVICRPACGLCDCADDSLRRRQQQRGNVGTRFPSRKHAMSIPLIFPDTIPIPASTIAIVCFDCCRATSDI